MQHIHEEMSPDDDIEVIIRKVFRTNISGLTDTFQLLDPADVEKAAEMIHRADRIEFYGNGGSGLIATDAYHKFMRTGINCIAHTDSHFQAMSAGLLGPESAVIGISHSGSNKDVLDAVKTAKSLGARHDRHYKLPKVAAHPDFRRCAVYVNKGDGFQNGSDVRKACPAVGH